MKYQFDGWQGLASISWAGELLFGLGWQPPGDDVWIMNKKQEIGLTLGRGSSHKNFYS